MTQAPAGGPAQTTYQVTDRALVTGRAAQRVFVVSDGRPFEGGPQQAVYYVSDAEIAAGEFVISGNKPIPITEIVSAAGAAYPPIAVYVVTAASASDFPPTVEPAPPDPIGDGLRADVVAYWTMDESSGTRIDATGHGNNLVDNNSVSNATGKINNAASFDVGVQQFLEHVSNSYLQTGDIDFSLTVWVMMSGLSGEITITPIIVSKVSPAFSHQEFEIYYDWPAKHFLFVIGDNYASINYPVDTFDLDEWHFITAWYDATAKSINLKVNGLDAVSGDASAANIAAQSDAPLRVGFDNTYATDQMGGRVDELGMWKRLLTPTEITYLYNSGAGRALFPAP